MKITSDPVGRFLPPRQHRCGPARLSSWRMTALLARSARLRHAVHVADVNVMHLIGLNTRHARPTAELIADLSIVYFQVAVALFSGLLWPQARWGARLQFAAWELLEADSLGAGWFGFGP